MGNLLAPSPLRRHHRRERCQDHSRCCCTHDKRPSSSNGPRNRFQSVQRLGSNTARINSSSCWQTSHITPEQTDDLYISFRRSYLEETKHSSRSGNNDVPMGFLSGVEAVEARTSEGIIFFFHFAVTWIYAR